MTPLAALEERYAQLEDPRVERTRLYPLRDILLMLTCAVLCGADDLVAVQVWCEARREWLRDRLQIAAVPSHDTFGRVLGALSPAAFSKCFLSWVAEVTHRSEDEVIAIDGKALRGSCRSGAGKEMVWTVSAFATKSGVVLGQKEVDEKSNEITAVPDLLALLDLTGAVVSLDAMGCQKEIARQIVEGGGDYVLALKGNQSGLHQEVQEYFEHSPERGVPSGRGDRAEERDYEHGRVEWRCLESVEEPEWLAGKPEWRGLRTLVRVERRREVAGKVSQETHYYISSLPGAGEGAAQRLLGAVRSHWGIENKLHWVLDVQMREDDCRVRTDHAPANLSTIRHVALNLLRQETSTRLGVKNKRFRANSDLSYLEQALRI